MMSRGLASVVALTVFSAALTSIAVEIETVPIGIPHNPADGAVAASDGTCCYGSVPYTYRIGVYEVTNAQYADFLNAIAATDTYSLYDPQMGNSPRGGIRQSGDSGSYSYSVAPNMANKPVNLIKFWDALRFTNWLHNGQPTGDQDDRTTEDGAYTMNGVTKFPNDTIARNEGARWYLPNENEWYKSAYYDPRTESQGGPPGDDHYWNYPTQSDEQPILGIANNVGDISNPGSNVANYLFSADWNRAHGNVTTVGSAGSSSATFFDTFDQAGNVWEWTDTVVPSSTDDRIFRGVRGGCWDDQPGLLGARIRPYGGDASFDCHGLRVATDFSPVDLDGNGRVEFADIDRLSTKVASRTLNTAYDLNADGVVDYLDRDVWVEDLVNTYFGDSNLDGEFNSRDFVDVFAAGHFEDDILLNSSWSTGDWDGDAEFDTADLIFVFQKGGYDKGLRALVESVPEPSSGSMLVLALSLIGASNLRGGLYTSEAMR